AEPTVSLKNPSSAERSVLRTSLLPGLLAAVARAQRAGVDRVRLFEVGTTFHTAGDAVLPREEARAAVVLAGSRDTWLGKIDAPDLAADFYDVKGVLEELVSSLTGRLPRLDFDRARAAAPFLHPRSACRASLPDG